MALLMFEKGANLLACQRSCEPLHVVFDEYLLRGALNGTGTLDRHVHTTGNGHVGAEKRRHFASLAHYWSFWQRRRILCHVERQCDGPSRTVRSCIRLVTAKPPH